MTEDEIEKDHIEWLKTLSPRQQADLWSLDVWKAATELAEKRHAEEIEGLQGVIDAQKKSFELLIKHIDKNHKEKVAILQKALDDVLDRHHKPL